MLSITEPVYLSALYETVERAKEHDTRFLSRLTHAHIQYPRLEQDEDMMSLVDLEAFLLLPSLRKLSGTEVRQTAWSKRCLEPPQASNVTDVELSECYIDSKILCQFIKQFPHLQTFVYTNAREDFDPSNAFDPFIIRSALQSQVPTTLRSLTILMDPYSDKPSFMGPLCGFKALEHVHSDWLCLLPGDMADSILRGDTETLSLILPKSLRVLSVRDHDHWYKKKYRKLVDLAIRAKRGPVARLPYLETLEFRMDPQKHFGDYRELQDDVDQDLQERCDEVGLSLLREHR